MSLDSTPQDEMEARLTALLLGELSAGEAAVVREAIAKVPALAQLHARLQQTIGLVTEAARSVAEETAAPSPALQLSKERREKMLRSFKVIKPQPSAWARWRMVSMRDMSSVAAMLVVLGLVAWVLLLAPALERYKLTETVGESDTESLSELSDGRRRWFFFEMAEGPSTARPQRVAAIPGAKAIDDGILAYRDKQSALSSRGELVKSLGEQELPLHDAPAVVNSPQPVAAEADRALRLPVGGRSSSARRLQSTVNWAASGPEATTPPSPAEVAQRGNGSVILPALTDPSPALGDDLASVNLWAENQPSATPRGEVRDLQRGSEPTLAALVAGTTPAREPLTADGFISTGFSDSTPRPPILALQSTNQISSGLRNTAGGFGGEGSGGGANALGWFGRTPAQPDYSAWDFVTPSEPGIQVNRSGDEVRRSVALTAAAPAASPAAGFARDGFNLDVVKLSIDGRAPMGAEVRFSNRLADDFVATTPVDASGVTVARGVMPAPIPEPATATPQKPQSAQSRVGLGRVVAKNEAVQSYDLDSPSEYSEAQLAAKSRGMNGTDGSKLNTELAISGRLSGVQPLNESKVDKKNGIQVEDEVGRQVLTRSVDRAVRSEAFKEAKPALQTSEPRLFRSRILLPEKSDSEERLKRESQIQNGPVSTSEIDAKRMADGTYDSLPLGRVIEEINYQAAKRDAALQRPAPTALIPQPEVVTTENAFSTFSLNVSDVSFKLAAAALEKGQMPDPATVRSEEFINAFDYRDQEPTGSAPIAFAWERARYPFAHDRDLVRFSVKTAASGRQPGRPLNLVLLVDNSGSMERADRIRIRQECLRVLASQLQPQDRMSVVAFARTARLWVDGLPGNQAGELPQRVGGLTPEGGTNLEDAMNLAYQTARRHFLANGVNRVVLLTDGAANLGDVQPESLKKKVEANRQQGIALDCFGIGWEGYNDDLLEALSRNGDGRYGFVNTPEAATTEFAGQLAGALKVAASDVKVQVEWNPRRVTAYRQIGYAKHQLKKEQFRDNTVDAAEIGAAEAGNALYTVQVNPAGEGPLGTMRVRFKVPGTSDYREHEWPLPYEGAAKSLDQSSATLRLAASASAFSEWLVSSPFAAEVTPDKLLGYLSNVPEAFSADPRPKKLEWMIRQAKSVSGK